MNNDTKKLTLSTIVQWQGRAITIAAEGYSLAEFDEMLTRRGFPASAPATKEARMSSAKRDDAMSSACTFTGTDPASVRRCCQQIAALADILEQLALALAVTLPTTILDEDAQLHLITAGTGLTLAAEDCRDAAKHLAALLP
jgi:hypothetical protein